jgi:hypothetical protein
MTENLTCQQQIRLCKDWLSCTISCRVRIPDFEQRYADVRLISATSVAMMMPLAFTQAC